MSITAQPPAATAAATARQESPQAVRVVSHSNLFYWWPVWVVGFTMALVTWLQRDLMAVVPPDTKAHKEIDFLGEKRPAYVLPAAPEGRKGEAALRQFSDPRLHISHSKTLGVIFCITLLLVIVITNVPLRGMWSLVVIITVIMLSVIFALAGWWETIFSYLDALDIRINMGGYLFISTGLFIVWLVTVMMFDKQTYMVFEPGQFKVCTEIGGGEKVYDTTGLALERQRADLFRHIILGLGSGDLIVKTTGAQAHHFDLPNVLFIGKKVQQIEDLLRQRKVVETK